MPEVTIKKAGLSTEGDVIQDTFRAFVQQEARRQTAAVTALVNNSGGAVATISPITPFVDVAASGSNLAGKATTEAGFTTVLDAAREIYVKANENLALFGLTQVAYSGGGAATDGTIAAVTVSVTGATTGVQSSSMNPILLLLEDVIYQAVRITNELCRAVGVTEISHTLGTSLSSSIAAITIDGGVAASPGVTKVAVDAALSSYRSNIKTIADKLIEVNTAATPKVVAG